MTLSEAKRPDLGIIGASKRFYLLKNGPLGAPRGPQKVQKWASDPYPINLGKFNHYVVPGTKSGGVQVFQMGKMCPIGFS